MKKITRLYTGGPYTPFPIKAGWGAFPSLPAVSLAAWLREKKTSEEKAVYSLTGEEGTGIAIITERFD